MGVEVDLLCPSPLECINSLRSVSSIGEYYFHYHFVLNNMSKHVLRVYADHLFEILSFCLACYVSIYYVTYCYGNVVPLPIATRVLFNQKGTCLCYPNCNKCNFLTVAS